APDAESPVPAVSPANFADAIRSSRQFARHSSDGQPASGSDTPLQTFALPLENPSRRNLYQLHFLSFSEQAPHRERLLLASPPPRSPRPGSAPGFAPARSSIPARCRANHNVRSPPAPHGPAAPSVPPEPRASAKRLGPGQPGPAYASAARAAQSSPRAAGKTNPRETFPPESHAPNSGASR